MQSDELLLLKGEDVYELLHGKEKEIMNAVGEAYKSHSDGDFMMPADGYVSYPGKDKERIISKSGYLGGPFKSTGMKWIASFPDNLEKGMERASATLILNSVENGRPIAVMESSIISARRTAASAALGAQSLWESKSDPSAIGLVGCGLINFETLRFLLATFPKTTKINLLDLSPERIDLFKKQANALRDGLVFETVENFDQLLNASPMITLSTTSIVPHINKMESPHEQAVLLHVSLRDFSADIILDADNVVDDIDKVISNDTSLHLAEKKSGNRSFVRSTIGDILNGRAPEKDSSKNISIYSPFGISILDLALGHYIYNEAMSQKKGTVIDSFLPKSWLER